MRTFTTSDFDFALPPELIAQHPAPERSGSRLLDGSGAAPVDRTFRDLPTLLREGDLLVFNDTQVVKARLFGEKPSGGKLELLIERVLPDGTVAQASVSEALASRGGIIDAGELKAPTASAFATISASRREVEGELE